LYARKRLNGSPIRKEWGQCGNPTETGKQVSRLLRMVDDAAEACHNSRLHRVEFRPISLTLTSVASDMSRLLAEEGPSCLKSEQLIGSTPVSIR